jgi:hypothetical protein
MGVFQGQNAGPQPATVAIEQQRLCWIGSEVNRLAAGNMPAFLRQKTTDHLLAAVQHAGMDQQTLAKIFLMLNARCNARGMGRDVLRADGENSRSMI